MNPEHDPATDPPFGAVVPTHSTDQPEILPLVIEPMRRLAEEMSERLLIGEIYLPHERLMRYYGEDGSGVHLPFNFALIFADWSAGGLCRLIAEYESLLPPGGWPNWVLGNHDQSRIATRIGPARARLAAILLLAGLRGTPTVYYGDEIGMTDVEIPPDRIRDPWERNMPGLGEGRDPCRTPMRWTDVPGAGFCPPEAEPWLPLGAFDAAGTVEGQRDDPASMLALHTALLRLRRTHPALSRGDYDALEARGDILWIVRREEAAQIAVALNFGDAAEAVALPDGGAAEMLLADAGATLSAPGRLHLPPHAAAIVSLSA